MADDFVEWTLGLRPESKERLLRDANNARLRLNVTAFSELDSSSIRGAIMDAIRDAHLLAGDCSLRADADPQRISESLSKEIGHPNLDLTQIDQIREVIACFTVLSQPFKSTSREPAPYPLFDLEKQRNVVRYGNVELAALESYLRDPDKLLAALEAVVAVQTDETAMYAKPVRKHYLATEDYAWNIRKLMTNAGFYAQPDVSAAWSALVDWAERYLSAMRYSYLAAYAGALPFSFAIMRMVWERFGEELGTVRNPTAFEVYPALEGQDVVFMSPLAEQVARQVESGNISRLFTNYQIPDFTLRTLPAWISTWPNRPHNDWSETFSRMCDSVDASYRQRPFDIFIASCGCYGLPICDYARSTYGCKTLYLGNIMHAFFGVRQKSTAGFARGNVDPDAWIDGDLSRYANLDRIDGGRYI
jgi:hypothetical protein